MIPSTSVLGMDTSANDTIDAFAADIARGRSRVYNTYFRLINDGTMTPADARRELDKPRGYVPPDVQELLALWLMDIYDEAQRAAKVYVTSVAASCEAAARAIRARRSEAARDAFLAGLEDGTEEPF